MEVSQVNDDDKASLGSRCAQGGSGYFMFISVRMDQGCLLRIQPRNWLVVQWSGLGAFTSVAQVQFLFQALRPASLAALPLPPPKKKRIQPIEVST